MSIAPVVIQFLHDGVPDVQAAMRKVADTVTATERMLTGVTEAEIKKRRDAYAQFRASQRQMGVGGARNPAVQTAKETAAAMELEAKSRRIAADEAARAEKTKAEAAKRRRAEERETERDRERAVDRERTLRNRAETDAKRSARETQQAANQQIRDLNQIAARKRELQNEETRQQNAARAHRNAQDRLYRAQLSNQMVRERESVQIAQTMIGAGGRGIMTGVRRLAGGVGAVASTMLSLGGGFSIEDSMHREMDLERSAALLANKDPTRQLSTSSAMASVKAAAITAGADPREMMRGWMSWVDKTGQVEEGRALMPFMGKVAKATGADFGEIAKTAGILRVQNKDLNSDALQRLLLQVVAQGKSGSFDFAELAGHAGAITKSAGSYSGDQTDIQRRLLGLSQIGARVEDVAGVATAISRFGSDAQNHQANVNRLLGRKAFDAKGRLVGAPEDFIADVIEKSHGNRKAIYDTGFRERSIKLFEALLPEYNKAEAEKKGSGRATILKSMQEFTAADMSPQQLEQEFANVMKTSGEQFEKASREFQNVIGEKLVPEAAKLLAAITPLIPNLALLLDKLIPLIDWAASNPLKAIGLVLAEGAAESVGKAAIGEAVKLSLTRTLDAVRDKLLAETTRKAAEGVADTAVKAGLGGGTSVAGQAATAGAGGAPAGALGGMGLLGSLGLAAAFVAPLATGGAGYERIRAAHEEGEGQVERLRKMYMSGGAEREAATKELAVARGDFTFGNAYAGVAGILARTMSAGGGFGSVVQQAIDSAGYAKGEKPGDIEAGEKTFRAAGILAHENEITGAAERIASALNAAADTVEGASRSQTMGGNGGTNR